MTFNPNSGGSTPNIGGGPGFFEQSPVGGDQDWKGDLKKIQDELHAIFAGSSAGHPLNEILMEYVLLLVQLYGATTVGQQSAENNHMQTYFAQIQRLWDDFEQSAQPGEVLNGQLYGDYNTTLSALENEINKDHFFDGPPGSSQQQMKQEILNTLATLSSIPANANFNGYDDNVPNKLAVIWIEDDPFKYGISSVTAAEPGDMDNLTRSLTQQNQYATGMSQTVQAATQADMKTYQTEQDQMNNWGKMMNTLVQKGLVANQRTQ